MSMSILKGIYITLKTKHILVIFKVKIKEFKINSFGAYQLGLSIKFTMSLYWCVF